MARPQGRGAAMVVPRLAVLAFALTLTACSGTATSSNSSNPANSDDGTQLSMWVRSATDQFSQRLVDAYNSSHKNHVALTIIPNDNYLTKVGTAAGSRSLPDILASDVVYTPNYTKQGLFQDLSADIKALPYAGAIAKSHLDVASYQGKTYAVPHKLDSSVFFYNKDLFSKAGLGPGEPPQGFTQDPD